MLYCYLTQPYKMGHMGLGLARPNSLLRDTARLMLASWAVCSYTVDKVFLCQDDEEFSSFLSAALCHNS